MHCTLEVFVLVCSTTGVGGGESSNQFKSFQEKEARKGNMKDIHLAPDAPRQRNGYTQNDKRHKQRLPRRKR